jgi:hypothetical protein
MLYFIFYFKELQAFDKFLTNRKSMKQGKKIFISVITIVFLCTWYVSLNAAIYKCIDDSGAVTFTNSPSNKNCWVLTEPKSVKTNQKTYPKREKTDEKNKLAALKNEGKKAQEITPEMIDRFISISPKDDKFFDYKKNQKNKESFLKKQGMVKFTVDTSTIGYKPSMKVWESIYKTIKIKDQHIKTSVGSNAFGVTGKYETFNRDEWSIRSGDNIKQNPEDARKTKTIIIYAYVINAELKKGYSQPTLNNPEELFLNIHDLNVKMMYAESIMSDGSISTLFPHKLW